MSPDPKRMDAAGRAIVGADEPEPDVTHPARQRTGKSIGDYNVFIGLFAGIIIGAVVGALTENLTMWILIGIVVGAIGAYLVNKANRSRS